MLDHLNYISELNREILSCFIINNLKENNILVELLKKSLVSEKI